MRVGLIIYGSITKITGGFIYDRKLVEHLRSQGVTVKIFSQKNTNLLGHIRNHLSKKMINDIMEFSPNVLLEDEMNFNSLIYLNKELKKMAKIPIISIVHLLQSRIKPNFFSRLITKKTETSYLKTVSGFIFNSYSTKKSVIEIIGINNNSLIAYPGKDQFQFDITEASISTKCKNEKFLVIFIGNLSYNKGLHLLLKALSQLDVNLWHLSIVGDQKVDLKYTKKIVKMITSLKIGNNITIYGLLKGEKLKNILLTHHLLVVPSYYESYGIVYTEAMGAGLPVIATKTGGALEIVNDKSNGFLIPPGDHNLLKDRIFTLIWNRELLKTMSLSSLAAFQNLPSWDETMTKVYTFLKAQC